MQCKYTFSKSEIHHCIYKDYFHSKDKFNKNIFSNLHIFYSSQKMGICSRERNRERERERERQRERDRERQREREKNKRNIFTIIFLKSSTFV